MEFCETFECTIMVQLYFHPKTGRLMINDLSIPDHAVKHFVYILKLAVHTVK